MEKKMEEQVLPVATLKTNYLAFVQGNAGNVHCTRKTITDNNVLNIK